MASKRDLKKNINYICSELFAECVASSIYSAKCSKENFDALLHSILTIHNDFVCRISHPEPGMEPADLTKNFNSQISEIVDQIANLN